MHFSLKLKYTYKVNKAIYYCRLQMFLTARFSSMDVRVSLILIRIKMMKIFDKEYTYDTSQIIRALVILCEDIQRRNHDKD